MIVPDQYVYVLSTLYFGVVWAIMFVSRKDLRREMLAIGGLVAVLQLPMQYFLWTRDWWLPPTMSGTRVGIEDFLLGLFCGGITASAYTFFGLRRIVPKRLHPVKGWLYRLSPLVLLLIVLLIGVPFARMTSFFAMTIGLIVGTVHLLILRKDLWRDAWWSGIIMVVISLPYYAIVEWLSPGYIDRIWLYEYLSGYKVSGIPFEELIFWLLFGYAGGVFYEFLTNQKVVKLRK